MSAQPRNVDARLLADITMRKSLDFSGRASRMQVFSYWAYAAFIYAIIRIIAGYSLTGKDQIILLECTRLVLSIPLFSLFVRRAHDANKPSYVVAVFIAFYLMTFSDAIYCLSTDGHPKFLTIRAVAEVVLWALCMVVVLMPGTIGANWYGGPPAT